jgi:hypothetical protein
MSTAASAASRARGCDVVTDSVRDHVFSSRLSEEGLYKSLLHQESGLEVSPQVTDREIGDLVISTTFDLSKMTARDFGSFSIDQQCLYQFSQLLSQEARKIPLIGDADQRLVRAKDAAEQIISMWEDRRRSWGSYLKGLFKVDSLEPAKDMATDMLRFAFAGGVAGATMTGTLLGAVPGMAVGLVVHGAESWREAGAQEREAPTYFLSKIAQHGGIVTASLGSEGRP